MSTLSLTVDRDPHSDLALIKLGGALDATKVHEFEAFVRDLRADGYNKIVFDLSQCRYMNETGDGAFVATVDNIEKDGGGAALINVPTKLLQQFKVMGWDSTFHVFNTRAEAITFLDRPRTATNDPGLGHYNWYAPRRQGSPGLRLVSSPMRDVRNAVYVRMTGALDATTVNEFEAFMKHLQEVGYSKFLFNFEHCKTMNETGDGSFIATSDNLDKIGGAIAIVNVHPKLMVVFKMLGHDRILHFFDSIHAAIEFLNQPRAQ